MAFHGWERVKKPNGNMFHDYKLVTYYTYHEVDEALEALTGWNYELCQISEGTLGSGTWICIPPEDNMYYYVFWEVALNEWNCGHRMRKCKKLTKEHAAWLAEYRGREEAVV